MLKRLLMKLLGIKSPSMEYNRFKNKNKPCKYCVEKAVVKCTTYQNEKIFMCSNCLRSFRFREKEYFKSVLPIGNITKK